MGSSLVVVAIPEENDRVWKTSSEKIPHLTVLFLGDSDTVDNLEQIVGFVEHAATQTLRRFYLPVDRRGELGEDQADVLFFKKGRYDYKAIRDFRTALLQDNNIKSAYDATSQFEIPDHVGAPGQMWIPHMTLGYPDTPAKPMDDNESYRFWDVCFDKIAVWVGDFEGPEFLLKDCYDEWDALETVPMDVSMSDLEHYGTKGMRWGVRKQDVASGAKAVGRGIGKAADSTGRFVSDVHFESQTNPRVDSEGNEHNSKAYGLVARGAEHDFRHVDLAKINAKPEHVRASKLRNRLLSPLGKETRAYRKEVKAAYINRLETTANSMKNASGNREYTIRERGGDLPNSKYYWEVSTRAARHADGQDDFLLLEVLTDENGFITGTKMAEEDSMAQTVALGEAFLEHYGVKGMRWGQRRSEFVTRQHQKALSAEAKQQEKRPSRDVRAVPTIGKSKRKQSRIDTKGGEDHPPTEDAIKIAVSKQKLKKSGPAALTNVELAEVQRRLNLENDVVRLTAAQRTSGQRFVDGLLGRGSKDDRRGAENQAGQAAQEILKKHAKKKFAAKAAAAALA